MGLGMGPSLYVLERKSRDMVKQSATICETSLFNQALTSHESPGEGKDNHNVMCTSPRIRQEC